MADIEVRIPDIGNFADVPVIEIHVAPGDTVAPEDPLVTLESDKATLDVPAPAAGTVSQLLVSVGDQVSEGTPILVLQGAGQAAAPGRERVREDARPTPGEPAGYGSPSGVYERIEVTVPDIGDFAGVPVIELHIAAGDMVAAEDPLITLESDKATMDIPAPAAGTIIAVRVAVGDVVSAGHPIADLETGQKLTEPPPPTAAPAERPGAATRRAPGDVHAEVLVLGAGPGGYTAAFRAADLGQSVVLADQRPALGGVCLNVGCIPSKALLHAARVIAETREMAAHGVRFGDPDIDLDALRGWKDGVVSRLTGGLAGLARQRKVTTARGTGRFVSPNLAEVTADDGSVTTVSFDRAIIAAGSSAVRLPFMPNDDRRVLDSTGALDLASVPRRLLVIGGGIIGLEMGCVYHELGARVTVVELMDQLIPGADRDIVAPLAKHIRGRYENIYLSTRVTGADVHAGTDAGTDADGVRVSFDGPDAPDHDVFDQVLVAVGRVPNGRRVGAENAGVLVDDRGYIPVDKQQRTNVPHIFAIGDVVGPPMLAHKATHEGRVAAEVAAGQRSYFDAKVIPSVAYTDPEVAWAGVTETEAKAAGVPYGKGVFPWAASGRALSLGRGEGVTKLLFDPASERLIGAGLVGPNAGELIAEVAHAIEMGADAADIALTIHPHPTLSETVGFSAEAFEGTITDLYLPKKKAAPKE
jgi:dihydrolipoamide dehydrogenase